ncbi:sensor histidine kinase [Hoeflea halophila]|nr:ATP-binding protein [Hoeflea halophila]
MILQYFQTNSFLAHGYCMTWRADLIALHAISDFLIFASFFIIPTALIFLHYKRPDLVHSRIALLFSAFILACGLTHLVGLVTLWQPIYGFEGVLKAGTAVVSGLTALTAWMLMPSALKMPSASTLKLKNDALALSINGQRQAYAELERAKFELDARIQARTRELREKAEALEQVNTSLSQYAHLASHDLQEPLRKMVSFSELAIEEEASGGPELKFYLTTIKQSASRARNLVRDILNHSAMDQSKPDIRPLSLRQETRRALETHELAIRERDGEVAVDMPDIVVMADPNLVLQILQNLIGNAIKYTPSDRRLKLSIDTAATHRGFDYTIEDNGIGIDPAFRDRIFQPFSQLQPERYVKGTGMGLAIVDKAIRQLGWKITVEAAHPLGTRFRISIPAYQLVQEGELVE